MCQIIAEKHNSIHRKFCCLLDCKTVCSQVCSGTGSFGPQMTVLKWIGNVLVCQPDKQEDYRCRKQAKMIKIAAQTSLRECPLTMGGGTNKSMGDHYIPVPFYEGSPYSRQPLLLWGDHKIKFQGIWKWTMLHFLGSWGGHEISHFLNGGITKFHARFMRLPKG